jgi:WD40 repeat protein
MKPNLSRGEGNPETELLAAVPDRNGEPPVVKFSGDGRYLATSTPGGKVRIYELNKFPDESEQRLVAEYDATFGDPTKSISSIGISRDGKLVAAGLRVTKPFNSPAELLAWNVATEQKVFDFTLKMQRETTLLTATEFSPTGSSLVTAGDGQRAVIWSLADKTGGTKTFCSEEHTGSIRSVAFSPDGKSFATTSADGTIILWNSETGKSLAPPLSAHKATVGVAVFCPTDCNLLASGSADHSVILWDVSTAQAIARLNQHTDNVRTLAFSDDGKRLFSGSWSKEALIWELDPAVLMEMSRKRANRNLSEAERSTYLHGSSDQTKTWPNLPEFGDEFHPTAITVSY